MEISKNTENFIKETFEKKWYTEVDRWYEGRPKISINSIPLEAKHALATAAGLKEDEWPDFSIVKYPEIKSSGANFLIPIKEDIRFSLWRILDDGETPHFECFKREWHVMRKPEFMFVGYWVVWWKLLIRK